MKHPRSIDKEVHRLCEKIEVEFGKAPLKEGFRGIYRVNDCIKETDVV